MRAFRSCLEHRGLGTQLCGVQHGERQERGKTLPPRTQGAFIWTEFNVCVWWRPTLTPLPHCPALASFSVSSHFLFLPLHLKSGSGLNLHPDFLLPSCRPLTSSPLLCVAKGHHVGRHSLAHIQSQWPHDLCFLHAFLGVFLGSGPWLRVLLEEHNYSFFLL